MTCDRAYLVRCMFGFLYIGERNLTPYELGTSVDYCELKLSNWYEIEQNGREKFGFLCYLEFISIKMCCTILSALMDSCVLITFYLLYKEHVNWPFVYFW